MDHGVKSGSLKQKCIESAKPRTNYYKPSSLFPIHLWKSVMRTCKENGLSKRQFRRLYLNNCEFSGYHRGNTFIHEVIYKKCALDILKLEQVALLLFPTYEAVTVVDVVRDKMKSAPNSPKNQRESNGFFKMHQGLSLELVKNKKSTVSEKRRRGSLAETLALKKSRASTYSESFNDGDIKILIAAGIKWPTGKFSLSPGKLKSESTIQVGANVIVRSFGVIDEERVNCELIGLASDISLQKVYADNAKFILASEQSRELAEDTVQKAQEGEVKERYSVNFLLFCQTIVHLRTLNFSGLVAFAISNIFDKSESLISLHTNCSSAAERRILAFIVAERFTSDYSQFLHTYSIFLFPLYMVQTLISRHLLGKNETDFPVRSFRDAWRQSCRTFVSRFVKDKKTSRHCEAPETHSEQQEICMKRSMIDPAISKNVKNVPGKRSLPPIKSKNNNLAQCLGCDRMGFIESSGFCISCNLIAASELADHGGYQLAKDILAKCSIDTDAAISELWKQEYDEKADKSFYYNVFTGESVWKLRPNIAKESVSYLSPNTLNDIKRKRIPEWLVKRT